MTAPLRKTLLTLLGGGPSAPAPPPTAAPAAGSVPSDPRDPLATQELELLNELAGIRAQLRPLQSREAALLRSLEVLRARRARVAPPPAPAAKAAPLAKGRTLPGGSRAEMLQAIRTREGRLRAVLTDVQAKLRAAANPRELRHAWVMGGTPHASLEQQLMQIWTDARPHLVAALVGPVRRDDSLNAGDMAEAQIGDLIRELTARQLLAVREQLAILMEHGPSEATLHAIAQATGLTARQTQIVARAVTAQLDAGASEATALRLGEQYATRLLEQRAQLIARTEAVRYTSQVVLARGAGAGGVVVKQWVSARDENVDEICQALDNGQRLLIGEPFITIDGDELEGPPAHPGCRCVPEIFREE